MERKLLILAILFILALIIIFETDLGSELGLVNPEPAVDDMMDDMPDNMPDDMMDDMPEDMPDDMPEEDIMP